MPIKTLVLFLALCMNVFIAQAQRRPLYFHVTTQYAGSIGMFSAGGGVSNKKTTMEHDLLYGYVPWAYGGETHKITYKFSVQPFKVKVSDRIEWKVINPGLFFAYNLGKPFTLTPDLSKYSPGYYWWSPALRMHVSFSTAFYLKVKEETGSKLMLYLEANSNDRYLTSYADNIGEIPFWDIWSLGIGAKYVFGRCAD